MASRVFPASLTLAVPLLVAAWAPGAAQECLPPPRPADAQVVVEVRVINTSDEVFDRIGLDFDINLKTGGRSAGQPQGPVSRPKPAFIDDVQLFQLMEAAQGDQRTNVMQAPRLTMFNGQSASLSVTNQQFFVTQVQAIQNGGQLVFLPTNTNFATGVQINLQPVVSGDRRFVRINFGNIQLTNLASAIVPLFPIVSTIQPFFEGIGNVGSPTLFTQFIQQPVFSSVFVQTTVVVPDGGTVLLGGLKRLSEGRNEFGPPVLSKIPYINRLFKNVGYGREVQNFMMMVTPRIIINEEEEIRQTGVVTAPLAGP